MLNRLAISITETEDQIIAKAGRENMLKEAGKSKHNADVHSKASLRSKQSLTPGEHKSPVMKSCVRSLVEFLCTQVTILTILLVFKL